MIPVGGGSYTFWATLLRQAKGRWCLDLVLVKVLPCRHLLDERCDVSVVEKQELPCLTLVHPSVALAKTHRLDIVHMLGEGQVLIIVPCTTTSRGVS